ncbi:hypothetical protein SCP_0105680 [Sparassis crispa]|uniref:Uncharacterized protein n=1 Tax=Sparassis crispa TaxID=139825 RepID=A0A401G693_9APHY|nr:hypothetical protein SCP_0105680 [Sparassis crispa]GBE77686.1 hypothetical protein SCP_0105680 [Sparassis crispa]
MSSTMGPTSQAKSWWSRSKSKDSSGLTPKRSFSNLVDDEKHMRSAPRKLTKTKDATAGLKFNTLASAMGFRSKKLPSLAIQDPPTNTSVHRSTSDNSAPSPFYTNRPPAKSVSTARSSEYDGDEASDPHDIPEPRTPSDHPRDRMSYQTSVLTLSEMDPFAAGGVVIQQSQDSYRQSVFSDSSLLEPHRKRSDFVSNNRTSYASSSSNSHSYLSEPRSGKMSSRITRSSRTPSDTSMKQEPRRQETLFVDDGRSVASAEPRSIRARLKTPSGSNSSCSTVTPGDYRNRLSEPPPGAPHPHPRARASDPHGFHSPLGAASPSLSPLTFAGPSVTPPPGTDSPVSPSSTRPLVLVRKASASIVHMPPPSLAPPTANLPPPPLSSFVAPEPSSSADNLSIFLSNPPSPSTSSVSLAPSFEFSVEDSAGDAIGHLMQDVYPPLPEGCSRQSKGNGRRRHIDAESSNSSMRRLPPPHGDYMHPDQSMSAHTSPKLLKKLPSQQSLLGKHYSEQSLTSSVVSLGQDEYANWRGSSGSLSSSKTPRKQRSFHHSRLPLPPLPALRHANSYNHSSTPPEGRLPTPSSPPTTDQQQRKSGFTHTTPTSARKRLFSGSSSRRSTSSQGPASPATSAEDETRSVINTDEPRTQSRSSSSAVQKVMISFGNFGHPLSLSTKNACVAPSSFWSEPGDSMSSSYGDKSASQTEYTPQHIIPPADMLKLEQQLAEEAAQRDREMDQEHKPKLELQPRDFGFAFIGRRRRSDSKLSGSRTSSIMSSVSAATLPFGSEHHILGESSTSGTSSLRQTASARPSSTTNHNGKARELSADSSRLPLRSSSLMAKSFPKPPTSIARPSTAQPSISSPTSPTFSAFTVSPGRPPTSLPPPPRSRPSRENQPIQDDPVLKRSSIVPLHPLSPPPVHNRIRRPHTATSDSRNVQSLITSPPSSFDQQKVSKRRSIMKKPSFLDIEDELDATTENLMEMDIDVPPASPVMEGSFLDMEHGRDSLDTDASCDSGFYA